MDVEETFTAGLQFKGQSHELTVPAHRSEISVEKLREVFDDAYWQRLRVRVPNARAVLVGPAAPAWWDGASASICALGKPA